MANVSLLSKKESFLQSTGIVLIFSGLQRAIDMIRGVVFARTLGPESYGSFTLAFLFLTIIVPLACLGLPCCYGRYTPRYEKKGMALSFLKKTVALSLVSVVIVTISVILFSAPISQMIYGESRFYYLILLASLAIVPNALFLSLQGFFAGLRLFKFYSLIDFSYRTLFMIFGIMLLFVWKRSAEAPLLGFALGLAASVVAFACLLKGELREWTQQKNVISETNFYRKIMKFSLWLSVTPIVFTLFHYTDRWMLNRLLGLHEVGLYSVAGALAYSIVLLGMVTGNTLEPNISSMWERHERAKAMSYLNLTSKVMVILLLGMAVVITIFRTPILSFLYGREYLEASQLMPILLMLSIVSSAYWVLGHYIKLVERTYVFCVTGICGLVANIFLNIIFIQAYGLIGAAIASTLSFFIILGTALLFNLKYQFDLDFRTVLVLGLTLILLLPSKLIILAMGTLIIICSKTNLIFLPEERAMITDKVLLLCSGLGRCSKNIVLRTDL